MILKKYIAAAIFTTCVGISSARATKPIQPITLPEKINLAKAELGKKLFFDPRLSKSGFISCNSCHNLSMGGTDNLTTSIGHNWQQGPINAPTVLNSSLNFVQFWDGRAQDLQEQAGGPIANPGEMAFSHELAVSVVQSIPGYVTEFKQTFGDDPLDIERITAALAEFEKTLVTPNSRFDQWLLGNSKALSKQELAGYQLFKKSGCISCHYGTSVGGNTFHKMGMVEEYATENPAEGRQGITGKAEEFRMFKVPNLRNIELTYPYFHDGAVATLSQAVTTMGRLQLGKKFSKEENAQIVAFLKSLTGEQPSFTLPILPPSSEKTPAPSPFE